MIKVLFRDECRSCNYLIQIYTSAVGVSTYQGSLQFKKKI